MASANVKKALVYNGTLTSDAIDYVTMTQPNSIVTILSAGSTVDIFVTVDGVTNPTIGGDNCYRIPTGTASLSIPVPQWADTPSHSFNPAGASGPSVGSMLIQLIAHGVPNYSVEVIPQ